jgi:hypothetical protein
MADDPNKQQDANTAPDAGVQPVTEPVNPLGPEPDMPAEPDRVGALQQQVQTGQAELAAAIQGLNSRIAELKQAKPRASEDSVFGADDDNKQELKELLSTVKEMKAQLSDNRRQTEAMNDRQLITNAVTETGLIVDQFNAAHDFTKNPKHKGIAAKIKNEVAGEIARAVAANPRSHGMTRFDVQRIWNEKLTEYREVMRPIYEPAKKADEVAAQAAVNNGLTPAAGPGASPAGGAAVKTYKDLNDPDWLRDTASGLKQSLKQRVAQRQAGG